MESGPAIVASADEISSDLIALTRRKINAKVGSEFERGAAGLADEKSAESVGTEIGVVVAAMHSG